jgi:C4-dicarboxylate transporter, DctM subunit
MPGGLALVCLIASAFFTTFTGGSGITIVAVGGLLMPAMLKERYPQQFTLGIVTTGGSLGILFPPSVPLVLYGIISNVSMNKLLVAGIIPGTLVVIALAIYGSLTGLKVGFVKQPFEFKRAWETLWIFKWELAIPIVLMAGFASGILRIHETSVFTALYVLFIETVIYRDIDIRKDLPRVVIESMTLVGAILIIMACAVGFTGWLIQAEVPQHLLELMQSMITSQFVFLLVLNIFLIIVGMLMEIFAAIVVAVPLVLPLARAYGIDPYHFAIIFLLNLEIAYLMPPLGINLFISSIRFGRPVTQLYRAVLPFIGVLFVTLMFVSYIPIITTWLPDKVKSHEINDADQGEPMGGEPLNDEDFGMTGDDLDDLNEKDAGPPDAGAADAGPADAGPPAAVEPPLTGWKAKQAERQKAAAEKKAATEAAAAEKKAAREAAAAAKKAGKEEAAEEQKK